MTPQIHTLEGAAALAAEPAIHAVLDAYNTAKTGLSDGESPLALVLRDGAETIIGGLWGRFFYNWLFIGLLAVPESLRGQNLGARLMAEAETIARARHCTGIWLDTFSFQARGFYEKRGFTVFGEITDFPPGHERYFLKKYLT